MCIALTALIPIVWVGALPAGAQHVPGAREQTQPASQVAAQRDLAFDDLPQDIQAMMRDDPSGTVPAWLERHPDATFRIIRRGPAADWRQVTLHDSGKEHGFLVFLHGEISVGNLDGRQFGAALLKSPVKGDIPERSHIAAINPSRAIAEAQTPEAAGSGLESAENGIEPDGASGDQPREGRLSNSDSDSTGRVAATGSHVIRRAGTLDVEHATEHQSETGVGGEVRSWLPMTGGPGLMWVATIIILALTIRTDRWMSWHNLDGLVLAAMCPLLLARSSDIDDESGWLGFSPRWWVHVALTGSALYWLVRGALLARSSHAASHSCNVSPGAMLVLLLFACGVLGTRVLTAEPSASSIDGIIGGRYFVTEGKLPFGRTPGYDTQSPLVYLLHAGVLKLTPAYVRVDGNLVPPEWSTRATWLRDGWTADAQLTAIRVVNVLLVILTLAALVQIGRRLHSLPAGLTMAAIFGVFPGTVECVNDPAVMLPAMLAAWSIGLATLGRFGGLLSTLAAVLAGVAWPYAWLFLPVLAAYFIRRSWRGLGAFVGIAGGAAASVAGLTAMVTPGLPRAERALRAAGESHEYSIHRTDSGVLELAKRDTSDGGAATPDLFKTQVWERLLAMESVTLERAGDETPKVAIIGPSEVSLSSVLIRRVRPSDAAAEHLLSQLYAKAVDRSRFEARAAAAVRTVLESTWLGAQRRTDDAPSAWAFFAATHSGTSSNRPAAVSPGATIPGTSAHTASAEERWSQYRRIAKIGVAVWSLLLAGTLLFGKPSSEHNLVGALLSIAAWITIAQTSGAAAHLPFLIVTALPLLAANLESEREYPPTQSKSDGDRPDGEVSAMQPRTLKLGPAPRISVE